MEQEFQTVWADMTNRSNLYWTNKTMKAEMELAIALAWDGKRQEEIKAQAKVKSLTHNPDKEAGQGPKPKKPAAK